jgi:diguanylate cyclase (GGDEF)-like protein/PAS domain S-box-containing protein
MFHALHCLQQQHDWKLVLLAAIVCLGSSATAVMLIRVAHSQGTGQRHWLLAAGIATGFGIWATHFTAMLAFDPGPAIGYRPEMTFISLIAAVALTTFGFLVAGRNSRGYDSLLGGAIVSVGIAAMHYLGMSALTGSIFLLWSSDLVILSVLLGLVFTAPAVHLAFRASTFAAHAVAGILLALGILAHHFVGMAAVTIVPVAGKATAGAVLAPQALAVAISLTAIAILALVLGAAIRSGRREAQRRRTEQDFRLLVDGITDYAIYRLHVDGTVASWNAGARKLKGYTPEEALGLPFASFYSEEDRRAQVPQAALAAAVHAGKFTTEGWRYRKDHSQFWAQVTIEPVYDERDQLNGFAQITRDVSEQQEGRERLGTLASNLDIALSNMHQGLCLFDSQEALVLSNDRAGAIFNLTKEECPPGTLFIDTLRLALERRAGSPVTDALVREVYERHRACQAQANGGMIISDFDENLVLAIRHQPLADGSWVSTYEDITDRNRSEARIAHMALHDGLTGLPNRQHFNERFEMELNLAERSGAKVAVISIDLDAFKEVNDTHGHGAGDDVLRTLSVRLGDGLGDGEFVARFGGDEFAALKTFTDLAELSSFVYQLKTRLSEAVHVGPFNLRIGASLGVATYPADATISETLINNADLAMYRAKSTIGECICYYEPEMDEAARSRRSLANDVRTALEKGQFTLVYQVQQSLWSGDVTGYEALIRWMHPVNGSISPVDFIPIAEESGAIIDIGAWVLRTACAEAARWKHPYKIAVNLSPVQIARGNLVELVREVLVQTGLSPSRLELEITETTIISDKIHGLHVLRQIKALGVTIAIDDFGTGYSSLDTLNSFPFDKIKIDRSFLTDAASSGQARSIIRAVLALGKSLGVPVLAEGVETIEQLEMLREDGCDEAQGFLLGRPGDITAETFPIHAQGAAATV